MSAVRALRPIVVIPARMASTRLPGKPLADIAGAPMIVHVWRRAMEADVGPVVVACAETAIAEAVEAAGGTAVLTRPDHPSGSDRIFEALVRVDPDGRHDVVVNLQGDLPTVDPAVVRAVLSPLADPEVDIATLVAPIAEAERARRSQRGQGGASSLAAGRRRRPGDLFQPRRRPLGRGPALPPHRHLRLPARGADPLRRAAARRARAARAAGAAPRAGERHADRRGGGRRPCPSASIRRRTWSAPGPLLTAGR